MLAAVGVGVVGAIAGGASAAVPAPMGRWWPAQTILSGFVNVTASEGNLGLGASPFGGFLLAGQGQASYCGPGGVAFSTPVAAPDDPVASGSPTFGPGGLGSLVGTQAGPGLHELNINDLDGVPPTFGNSSEVASGNTLNGVSDVTAAEGTSGDLAVAWLVNIPSQVLLTVRPAGVSPVGVPGTPAGGFPAAQAVDPDIASPVARLSVAVDGRGDTTVVAPSSSEERSCSGQPRVRSGAP